VEREVIEETVRSLVQVLVSGDELKRPSVLTTLDELDVDLNDVVDALVPLLDDLASTQVPSHRSLTNSDSCPTYVTMDKQKPWISFCGYDLSAF